jgi:hypothetical protein
MKKLRDIVLLIETIVAVAFPMFMLFIGTLFSPFLIVGALTGANAGLLVVYIVGILGVFALINLAVKASNPESSVLPSLWIKVFLVLGLALAIRLSFEKDNFSFIYMPTILVTIHFSYIARDYLWKSS